MRQLVFVHGRAQENKDAVALKGEWMEALGEGLAKSGLRLPIRETDVRFPFYGSTLYELTNGRSAAEAAEIVVRGVNTDPAEEKFIRAVLEELRQQVGITEAQLLEIAGQDVIDRGLGQWEWAQSILRAVDRFVPYGSGGGIALATRDVYQYLKNSVIRQHIDDGVAQAFSAREAVVVSHSLGTVVAYNMLTQQGGTRGWSVPLFITLGSPLGITEVRKTMRGLSSPLRCPPCASAWFNAMDEHDVVALYSLTAKHFPTDPAMPAIENKTDVKNRTSNRHGISGYLDDAEVAKRIHDALIA